MKLRHAAVALILAPALAQGADLGLRKSYPASPETTAPAPWTGPYLGVTAGAVFGTIKDPYVTQTLGALATSGALGGMALGYNHQIGEFVVGLEADYALARARGHKSDQQVQDFGAYRLTGSASVRSTLESFGSIRARAGLSWSSAMLFATAGYAFGRNTIAASATGTYVKDDVVWAASSAGSDSKWMNGWVLGGGVEYPFTANISGKLEYLYADLGKTTVFKSTWAEDGVSNKVNILRAGVNYRF
jgi:outer membrane immunogenic protein